MLVRKEAHLAAHRLGRGAMKGAQGLGRPSLCYEATSQALALTAAGTSSTEPYPADYLPFVFRKFLYIGFGQYVRHS